MSSGDEKERRGRRRGGEVKWREEKSQDMGRVGGEGVSFKERDRREGVGE